MELNASLGPKGVSVNALWKDITFQIKIIRESVCYNYLNFLENKYFENGNLLLSKVYHSKLVRYKALFWFISQNSILLTSFSLGDPKRNLGVLLPILAPRHTITSEFGNSILSQRGLFVLAREILENVYKTSKG